MSSIMLFHRMIASQRQQHPLSQDLVLRTDTDHHLAHHQPLTSTSISSNTPTQPFRLLDLPLEIQRLIYTHYYNGAWSVTLDYERLSMLRTSFHIKGCPSTSLLLVSHSVSAVAQEIRWRCFTGRLTLNSVFMLIPLRKKAEFDWLKRNVRILHFSDSSVRPERWGRYYSNFERLERLEIDFPSILALGEECRDLEDVLRGKRDDVLVANLEPLRTASVGELGEEITVVISQRFKLQTHLQVVGWKGILSVKVQLASDCASVLERIHDPDVDIISKRQFTRHEL